MIFCLGPLVMSLSGRLRGCHNHVEAGILGCIWTTNWYIMSRNLDHVIRRPRRRYRTSNNPPVWPEESLVNNTILSAIWGRQCKESKDFNFGTRATQQKFLGRELLPLDYTRSLGEVYSDLTANMLLLTRSKELLLAALRSQVPESLFWTVDWSLRSPMRRLQLGSYAA